MFWKKSRVEGRCFFCEAPREAVHLLVAGPNASICAECLALGLSALEGEVDGVPSVRHYGAQALLHYLARFIGRYPAEESVKPLVDALRALLPDDQESRLDLAARLLNLPYPTPVAELLASDESVRGALLCVVAQIQLGDYEGASRAVGDLEARRDLDEQNGALLAHHALVLTLRRGTLRDGSALDRSRYGALLADLDELAERLRGQELLDAQLERTLDISRAECFLHRGDSRRALELLDVEPAEALGPAGMLLLGEAHAAAGARDRARAAWRELLGTFPHAPQATKAEERLLSLDSTPYR